MVGCGRCWFGFDLRIMVVRLVWQVGGVGVVVVVFLAYVLLLCLGWLVDCCLLSVDLTTLGLVFL